MGRSRRRRSQQPSGMSWKECSRSSLTAQRHKQVNQCGDRKWLALRHNNTDCGRAAFGARPLCCLLPYSANLGRCSSFSWDCHSNKLPLRQSTPATAAAAVHLRRGGRHGRGGGRAVAGDRGDRAHSGDASGRPPGWRKLVAKPPLQVGLSSLWTASLSYALLSCNCHESV